MTWTTAHLHGRNRVARTYDCWAEHGTRTARATCNGGQAVNRWLGEQQRAGATRVGYRAR